MSNHKAIKYQQVDSTSGLGAAFRFVEGRGNKKRAVGGARSELLVPETDDDMFFSCHFVKIM